MDRDAFRLRMQQYKLARENNPLLKYWDWKKELDLGYQLYKAKLHSNLLLETADYDLYGAYKAGLLPQMYDDSYYHLSSRDPNTGRILKSKSHPTYQQALLADSIQGYFPYEKDGWTYTRTYSPIDISGYQTGSDGINPSGETGEPSVQAIELRAWLNNWLRHRTKQMAENITTYANKLGYYGSVIDRFHVGPFFFQNKEKNAAKIIKEQLLFMNGIPIYDYREPWAMSDKNIPYRKEFLKLPASVLGAYHKSYGKPEAISVSPIATDPSTILHELSHATLGKYAIQASEIARILKRHERENKVPDKYLDDPDEVYSRLNLFRYENGINPEDEITKELVEDWKKSSKGGYEFIDRYSTNTLLDLLNGVAYNKPEKSNERQILRAATGGEINRYTYGTDDVNNYITEQIKLVKEKALDKSRKRDRGVNPIVGGRPNPVSRELFEADVAQQKKDIEKRYMPNLETLALMLPEFAKQLEAKLKEIADLEAMTYNPYIGGAIGPGCIFTATDNYGPRYIQVSNNLFQSLSPSESGFTEVPIDTVLPADIVIRHDDKGGKHAMIFDSYDENGVMRYNHSNGGGEPSNYRHRGKYPARKDQLHAYTFTGTHNDSILWRKQFKDIISRHLTGTDGINPYALQEYVDDLNHTDPNTGIISPFYNRVTDSYGPVTLPLVDVNAPLTWNASRNIAGRIGANAVREGMGTAFKFGAPIMVMAALPAVASTGGLGVATDAASIAIDPLNPLNYLGPVNTYASRITPEVLKMINARNAALMANAEQRALAANELYRVILRMMDDPSYLERALAVQLQFGDDYMAPYADALIAYNSSPKELPKIELFDDVSSYGYMQRTPEGQFIYGRNVNIKQPNNAEHELSHFTDMLKSGSTNAEEGNKMFALMQNDLTRDVDIHDSYFKLPTELKAHMNLLREWMYELGYITNRNLKVNANTMKKVLKEAGNTSGLEGVERASKQFKDIKTYTKWFNTIPLISTVPLMKNND